MGSSGSTLILVQHQLTRYGLPVYLLFGNIGNILNCLVFLQKSLRSSSCSLYFIALSITNLILLDFGIPTRIYSDVQINPSSYSLMYCKLVLYIFHGLLMISRSYIVLICIDRYCMCSPRVFRRNFSHRHIAIWIILLVPIIWLLIASFIPILNQIQNNRCVMPGTYEFVYSIYSAVVAGILPPLLMIIFTILTYLNICQMRKRVLPASIRIQQRIQRRDQQLFGISICQVVIYILSTWLYPSMTSYLTFIKQSTSQTPVEQFLNYLSSPFLIYINNSATFYIYICISSSFRAEFKRIILSYCFRRSTINRQVDTKTKRRNVNRGQVAIIPIVQHSIPAYQ